MTQLVITTGLLFCLLCLTQAARTLLRRSPRTPKTP